MKKMTFEVSSQKEERVSSLIKEINKNSYRFWLQIDLENGLIVVENVDDTMIGSVIDLIGKYYNILNVTIDNTSKESTLVETSQNVTDGDETKFKVVVKEIRFGPQTDDHDYNFKLKHAENFLKEGAKVKAYVFFRGRQIVFKDQGEILLLRFVQDLEEWAKVEQMPKLEGKRMSIMLAPKAKK